jgi:hypothetical protein
MMGNRLTTLPELFALICCEREMDPERTGLDPEFIQLMTGDTQNAHSTSMDLDMNLYHANTPSSQT